MPVTTLKNAHIQKREDKNFNPYFLIMNKENEEETYTAFKFRVREGWQELENSWQKITEIELEYEEKEYNDRIYKNVVGCYFLQEGEIIL